MTPKVLFEGWYQLCMQIICWAYLYVCVFHIYIIPKWVWLCSIQLAHKTDCAWLTFALNLQYSKLFCLGYRIQPLLLCVVFFVLFVCLHFSHYTLTFSANVSFYNVHLGELIQQVFHLLFQAACLWKWASSMYYSIIQERWMWLQAGMCYPLVFKKQWSAISYSCNIAPESCPRKEN